MKSPKYLAPILCCSGSLLLSSSLAQPAQGESVVQGPVKRIVLLKHELEDMTGKELHAWVAEIEPSAHTGKHKHPWQEFVYILDGALEIEVDGGATTRLEIGDLYGVPAGQPHEARNLVAKPTRALVFGVAPKGEPLVVPLD